MFEAVTVVDGTGAPRYVADVTVEGERIARIERMPGSASGMVLAPGCIDMHVLFDPETALDRATRACPRPGSSTF